MFTSNKPHCRAKRPGGGVRSVPAPPTWSESEQESAQCFSVKLDKCACYIKLYSVLRVWVVGGVRSLLAPPIWGGVWPKFSSVLLRLDKFSCYIVIYSVLRVGVVGGVRSDPAPPIWGGV